MRRFRWLKRLLAAAVLLGATPSFAAITWLVVNDPDCTGFNAAANLAGTSGAACCRASAAAAGNWCTKREYLGDMIWRFVTFAVGASSAYTAGGDVLNAAALQKIGLQNVLWSSCGELTPGTAAVTGGGQNMVWLQTAPVAPFAYGAKIQIFQTGAGGTTPVTNGGEFAGSLANVNFVCALAGY